MWSCGACSRSESNNFNSKTMYTWTPLREDKQFHPTFINPHRTNTWRWTDERKAKSVALWISMTLVFPFMTNRMTLFIYFILQPAFTHMCSLHQIVLKFKWRNQNILFYSCDMFEIKDKLFYLHHAHFSLCWLPSLHTPQRDAWLSSQTCPGISLTGFCSEINNKQQIIYIFQEDLVLRARESIPINRPQEAINPYVLCFSFPPSVSVSGAWGFSSSSDCAASFLWGEYITKQLPLENAPFVFTWWGLRRIFTVGKCFIHIQIPQRQDHCHVFFLEAWFKG